MAPCVVVPSDLPYQTFIDKDWKAKDVYPNLFGEGFSAQGYCDVVSNEGYLCELVKLFEPYGVASADIRSVFQF